MSDVSFGLWADFLADDIDVLVVLVLPMLALLDMLLDFFHGLDGVVTDEGIVTLQGV